jgi:hypothetical protein
MPPTTTPAELPTLTEWQWADGLCILRALARAAGPGGLRLRKAQFSEATGISPRHAKEALCWLVEDELLVLRDELYELTWAGLSFLTEEAEGEQAEHAAAIEYVREAVGPSDPSLPEAINE